MLLTGALAPPGLSAWSRRWAVQRMASHHSPVTDDADDVLLRLGLDGTDAIDPDDLRRLVQYVIALGATDEEVVAAARVAGLGPLGLDLAMRPPGATLSVDEFAAGSGTDPSLVRRLWQGFGLPETSDSPLRVTPDAAQALRLMAALADRLGEDAVLGFARVVGLSVARLADALSSATRVGVEVPQREGGTQYSDIVRGYTEVARDLLPALWDAIGAIFRRHLVLVSYQRWSTDEDRVAVTVERSVGFVDLVGSTTVLRGLSVAGLAALVDRFEQLVWDVVTSAGGRIVKLIGDEAMFVADDPMAGCRIALRLIDSSNDPVRVGLAFGPVVALHGDFYGPTVNLAARLVSVAPPSTIVASEVVHAATSQAFEFTPFTTGPLRGFTDPMSTYELQHLRT